MTLIILIGFSEIHHLIEITFKSNEKTSAQNELDFRNLRPIFYTRLMTNSGNDLNEIAKILPCF